MADSRIDVDPNRGASSSPREIAAYKKLVGDRGLDVAAYEKVDPPSPSQLEDALAICTKLSAAYLALSEALPTLEEAKELAVNHPVVPGNVRGAIDSAYDHIVAAEKVYGESVETLTKVTRLRLGPNNVCQFCGAGTLDPGDKPWHWPGCPLAESD